MRLAHRGDWRHAPENSLAAIRAAVSRPGVDGVEFDVRASADGVAVLIHDVSLERVQGVAARAADLTAQQLAARGVASLGEVLDAVGPRPFLTVELKEWVPAALSALDAARGRDGGLEQAVVSSFDHEVHRQVARARPGWRRWFNTVRLDSAAINDARELGCEAVSAQWRAIDAQSIARARAAKLGVAAWTVRRRSTYRRLERVGVTAIFAEAAALDG